MPKEQITKSFDAATQMLTITKMEPSVTTYTVDELNDDQAECLSKVAEAQRNLDNAQALFNKYQAELDEVNGYLAEVTKS